MVLLGSTSSPMHNGPRRRNLFTPREDSLRPTYLQTVPRRHVVCFVCWLIPEVDARMGRDRGTAHHDGHVNLMGVRFGAPRRKDQPVVSPVTDAALLWCPPRPAVRDARADCTATRRGIIRVEPNRGPSHRRDDLDLGERIVLRCLAGGDAGKRDELIVR